MENCPFCDSIGVKAVLNPATASQRVECDKCGEYVISAWVLSAMTGEPHWQQIREILSKEARRSSDVGSALDLNDERDVKAAISAQLAAESDATKGE